MQDPKNKLLIDYTIHENSNIDLLKRILVFPENFDINPLKIKLTKEVHL